MSNSINVLLTYYRNGVWWCNVEENGKFHILNSINNDKT